MSYYKDEELKNIGFALVGEKVLISRHARFYNPHNIYLGSNIRIDDFCVLSAGKEIIIEDYVHLAVGCLLIGHERIYLSKFCGLSSRVSIYSSTDDYSGNYLTNPTVPNEYRNVCSGSVFIGKHVIIGSGSVILPNVNLEEGVAIGALSVIRKNCKSYGVYLGNPARYLKDRSRKIVELEKQFYLGGV